MANVKHILTFHFRFVIGGTLLLLCFSCAKNENTNTLFVLLEPDDTGVHFTNSIKTNDSINLMTYEYLYNGGGVGIGHFNNDSLPDLFFTGNQVESKLYLNKGDFKFEDITMNSGIVTLGKWCTGVSIVDINSDGLDDIYISVGGMGNKNDFPNLLYINQGNNTFKEEASKYGLADAGESIQSVFFDYDLDGDLDMYLLTGGGFEQSAINARPILTNGSGRNTDRLYRNDFNKETGLPFYTNVSSEAGISIEGFGLGVSVFDVNQDSYPDIYVSNDYLSRDLLYINNQDGTFSEQGKDFFGHMSHFSMGNDVADIDNDGLMDLVTMDMLPENYKRRKLMSGASSYDFFQMALRFDYGHQHMRNMLQKNNGNNRFSEIGQFSGIDKTDWSWAPLLADFDNDGYNDLFITNGYGKDITDLDFVKYRENSSSAFADYNELRKSVVDCLAHRPAIEMENYIYKNNGDLTFSKKIKDWGFDVSTISNGAAYGDLDLDGDLDLVINNINSPISVYQNNLIERSSNNVNYLKVKLKGSSQNSKGFGAKVSIYAKNGNQTRLNNPVRGFQSTVESIVHFGVQDVEEIDSLIVTWPDSKKSVLTDLKSNQTLQVDYSSASFKENTFDETVKWLTKDSIFDFSHKERPYNDYAVQPLMTHGFSNQGPGMAVGDLNGDGLEDVFIGGAYGFKSTMAIQKQNGGFELIELEDTELYEDLGVLIFDANEDGLNDIYVVSGGSERYAGHEGYEDRLYLNYSYEPGSFIRSELPKMTSSTASVSGGDFDRDGDIDLFIGGRVIPGSYPKAPQSYLLENRSGTFVDITHMVSPKLREIGMVTSAIWTDFDNDNYLDLVLVGEYMPVSIFKGDGKKLTLLEDTSGLENSTGLWNSLLAEDFDNDGDVDFVVGNLGLNSSLKADRTSPVILNYADFDGNGFIDPLLSHYVEEEYYPWASLDALTKQLPEIRKKILFYNTYAKSTTEDILSLFDNVEYQTLKAEVLASSYIENKGNAQFEMSNLPMESQIAPIKGMQAMDINQDGYLDLVMVGNNYNTEVVYGRYDASIGNVLMNNGDGSFKAISPMESGFSVIGDARSMVELETKNKGTVLLVGRNNEELATFSLNSKKSSVLKAGRGESYAIIHYKDSKRRKKEFTLGGGYLSQSSNIVRITPQVESVVFYNILGIETRTINLTNNT